MDGSEWYWAFWIWAQGYWLSNFGSPLNLQGSALEGSCDDYGSCVSWGGSLDSQEMCIKLIQNRMNILKVTKCTLFLKTFKLSQMQNAISFVYKAFIYKSKRKQSTLYIFFLNLSKGLTILIDVILIMWLPWSTLLQIAHFSPNSPQEESLSIQWMITYRLNKTTQMLNFRLNSLSKSASYGLKLPSCLLYAACKLLEQFIAILFIFLTNKYQQAKILMPIRLNTLHSEETVILFHQRPINVSPFWFLVCLVVGEGCLLLLAFLYLRMVLESITITPSNSILTKSQHKFIYYSVVVSLALMGVCAAIENCWNNTAWGLYAISSILFLFFTILVSNLDRVTIFINTLIGIMLSIVLNFLLTESSVLYGTTWVSLLIFFIGWAGLMVINQTLIRLMEFITVSGTFDDRLIHIVEAGVSLLVTGWLLLSKKMLGYNWWYLVGIWVGQTILIMMVLLQKLKICL